eukprot:TRINITY_DN24958_c0_g1_i1.p1 TRINITY_DN24958_c0_g1~~TRINITY_DN24958_c0_g1_i1.p1  ORF type:complete len:471 (+),score=128.42 TRINITY_DN24958_c0_g1_i1:106-1518(+)
MLDFSGLFGGNGGSLPNLFGSRFTCQLKCYPVSFNGREDLECGNKCILPPAVLQQLTQLGAPSPMLFEVSDLDGRRRTHVGVIEFVAPQETCYIPFWILKQLQCEEGDVLQFSLRELPKATSVKLRPASVALLRVYNPRALLENGLRNYVVLTAGDSFNVEYRSRLYGLQVAEVTPGPAACIVEADVQVDFLTPKDQEAAAESISRQELERSEAARRESRDEAAAAEDAAPASKTASRVFGGVGQRIDGGEVSILAPEELPDQPAAQSESRLFSGAGQRIDGLEAPPREETTGSEDDEMPWKKRIPRGVKWTSPPYGVGDLRVAAGVEGVAGRPPEWEATAALKGLASVASSAQPSSPPREDAPPPQSEQRAQVLQAAAAREEADAAQIAERRRSEEEKRKQEAQEAAEQARKLEALEEARRRRAAAHAEKPPEQVEMLLMPQKASLAQQTSRQKSGCCACCSFATPVPA